MKSISKWITLALAAIFLSTATAQDTFRFAAQADAVGLSPVLTNDSVSSHLNRQIYENLTRFDTETGQFVGWLAESWDTPDENTWIFHLREGVTFHDGTPFNAEAVKETFERIKDPETGSPRASLMAPVANIEVVNEHTLKVETHEPYGAFLAALAHTNAAIESPAAVAKYGDLMRNPVGTGPYKFVNWVSGDNITLEAYAEYWGGEPAIKQIHVTVIPDINTQVAMLERGDIDLITTIPPELASRLEGNQNLTFVSRAGTPVRFLGFNHQDPLWQDKNARLAVAHAVNTEAIVQLLQPAAVGPCSIIGPELFGYTADAPDTCVPYDPDTARELWESVEGKRPVKIFLSNTDNYARVGQIIQGQLSQVGIQAEITMLEWGALLAETLELNHDLYVLGWSNVTGDGSELFYPQFHSDNIGSSNRNGYSNEEADRLIDLSRSTTDQEAREEYLRQANHLLQEDVAWVTTYHEVVLVAHNAKLQGLEVQPNSDWYVFEASFTD